MPVCLFLMSSKIRWVGLITGQWCTISYIGIRVEKGKNFQCWYKRYFLLHKKSLLLPHSTLLQAEEKLARNSVPKCPFKQPQPASRLKLVEGTNWDWVTRALFLQLWIPLTVDVLYNYSQVGSQEMRLKWRTCEKIPAFSKQTHSM